jgi:hypothetical protein
VPGTLKLNRPESETMVLTVTGGFTVMSDKASLWATLKGPESLPLMVRLSWAVAVARLMKKIKNKDRERMAGFVNSEVCKYQGV